MNKEDLQHILERHKEWIGSLDSSQAGGESADLSETDLDGVNLHGTNLNKANLQGAHLRGADLRAADLRESNLKDANLLRTRLEEADLRNTDLSEVGFLVNKQMAGADISGAILPESTQKFDGLIIVEEISRNARKLLLAMLLGCIYAWLTISTTTDPLLLTNSVSSPLPIIGVQIPIAGFFWVAPVLLLGLYLYFHLYLQRLWETYAGLPAVFPDGSRLDERAYPWLLNSLVTKYINRLRREPPRFSRLQFVLSIISAWWIVPVTLFFFWLRYLPRHDWPGTFFQISILLIAVGSGLMFYSAAKATLRREAQISMTWENISGNIQYIKRFSTITVTGLIMLLLSFGAIHGTPHDSVYNDRLHGIDMRRWVPRVLASIGFNPFADFIESEISTKPDDWVDKKGQELGLVKGARLKGANLTHLRAGRAFLINADLREANLAWADLTHADLRGAYLQGAILKYAKLDGAKLRGVHLQGADMEGVTLKKYKYEFTGENLSGINFKGATLVEVNLQETDLRDTDFEEANLQAVKLGGANLRNANMQAVKFNNVALSRANIENANLSRASGLTLKGLKETINTVFAVYDDNYRTAFGLPADLSARIQQKNFRDMNLQGFKFEDLQLQKFDFQGADLQGANFTRVDLSEANLKDANLKKVTFSRGPLNKANLEGADLQGARIDHLDLNYANLRGANLEGAKLLELDLSHASLQDAEMSGVGFWNWVNLKNADLKGTRFFNINYLGNVKGLTCEQWAEAIVDDQIRLPDDLKSCKKIDP